MIDDLSFTTLVPVFQLDSEKAYNGINLFTICNEKNYMGLDIRAYIVIILTMKNSYISPYGFRGNK